MASGRDVLNVPELLEVGPGLGKKLSPLKVTSRPNAVEVVFNP